MLGETIGSYRITGKLGEGGMGAVYSAVHEVVGKRVAIKVLLPQLSTDEAAVARFVNEARAASRIEHPGIATVFDFGYHQGAAYIVMELLRGEPLSSMLRRQGSLPPELALTLLRQMLGALAAAHAAGICHRDLKPDNVFITPDPDVEGGKRIKLLDFGIAKLSDTDTGVRTRTGSVIGTPTYMAPEQCRSASNVDARSDLYAAGVILFEMLTGRPPFCAEGLGDLLAQHMFEPPPSARSINAAIEPALESTLMRSLAKNPDQRYQTAEQFASALGAGPRQTEEVPATPLTPTLVATPTTLGGAAAEIRSLPAPKTARPAHLAAAAVATAGLVIGAALLVRGLGAPRLSLAPTLAIDAATAPIDAATTAPIDAEAPPQLDAATAHAIDAATPPPIDATPPRRAAVTPPQADAAPHGRVTAKATPAPRRQPVRIAPSIRETPESALAAGKPRRAIDLAKPLLKTPARARALRVMVLAYCRLHNPSAARSAYGALPANRRSGLAGRCSRSGVALE